MTTLTDLNGALERAVAELPAADRPAAIGACAAAQARLLALVTTPSPTAAAAPTGRMLSAEQVAVALGVKASAVYEWARAGRIPVEKFGRFSRFDLDAVRQALTSNPKTVRLGVENQPRKINGLRGPLTGRLPRHPSAEGQP